MESKIDDSLFKPRLDAIFKVLQVIDQSGEIELDITTPECQWIIGAIIYIFENFQTSGEIFGPDIVIIDDKEIRCLKLFRFHMQLFSILAIDEKGNNNIIVCGYFANGRSYINNASEIRMLTKCTLVWLPNRCRVHKVFEQLDLFDEENLIDIVLDYLKFKQL